MKTSIQWCDHSINPLRARHKATGRIGHYCEKIASGCKFSYSSRMQRRFGTPEFGGGQLRDEYELFLDESKLDEVRRRRIPTRYFWCDMTDIFGDWVQADWLRACFATMDATPQHTHLLLTKRPQNVRRMWPGYDNDFRPGANRIHFGNIHLLYSASDQASLEAGLGYLHACDNLCSVVGLSLEPQIGPIRFHPSDLKWLQWIIVGGESGPNSRPCNLRWIRDIIAQCKAAGVPVFTKQLGARPIAPEETIEQVRAKDTEIDRWPEGTHFGNPTGDPALNGRCILLKDKKGGDWEEWPSDLRVRESAGVSARWFPAACRRWVLKTTKGK